MFICLTFTVLTVLNFVLMHWDLCITVAAFLVYSVKATKWGKANSKALETVAGVIESLNRTEIKEEIKARSADLPKHVVEAIEDAVAKVDVKKEAPAASNVVVREALRGIKE